MTLEEKLGKTLEELGVTDTAGVQALFAELGRALELERNQQEVASRGDDSQRQHLVKSLRDRWLSRKHGLLTRVDENWLKAAPKELRPIVGREFNQLRQMAEEKIVRQKLAGVAAQATVPYESVAEATPDLTLPGYRRALGSIHPVMQIGRASCRERV